MLAAKEADLTMIIGQIKQFLSVAVRYKVGTRSSEWNCERDGHFVPPEDLSKKLASLCKTRGADLMPNESVPFLSKCMNCHIQIGCRLTMNAGGQVVKYTRALETAKDLRRWFTEQNEQKFSTLVPEAPQSNIRLACFCTKPSVAELDGIMLCKEHLLQVLLIDKFQMATDHRAVVERIKSGADPGLVSLSAKKENEAWVMLMKLLSAAELPEFFLHATEILPKLRVGTRSQKEVENTRVPRLDRI